VIDSHVVEKILSQLSNLLPHLAHIPVIFHLLQLPAGLLLPQVRHQHRLPFSDLRVLQLNFINISSDLDDLSFDPSDIAFHLSDLGFDPGDIAFHLNNFSLDPVNICSNLDNFSLDPIDICSDPINIRSDLNNFSLDLIDIRSDLDDLSFHPVNINFDLIDIRSDLDDLGFNLADIGLDPIELALLVFQDPVVVLDGLDQPLFLFGGHTGFIRTDLIVVLKSVRIPMAGRLVITHNTYVEGLIPVLRRLAACNGIQTVTPAVIGQVRGKGRSAHLSLRVSVPTQGGFKVIARKGSSFQEVFVVTTLTQEQLQTLLAQTLA
jgi:uncharacterized protein Smg (DUF494 family)